MYCRVTKNVDERFKRISYKVIVEDDKTQVAEEFEPCFVGNEKIFISWPNGKKVEEIVLKRKIHTDAVVEHGHAYEVKSYVYGFWKTYHGAELWVGIEQVLISFYNRQNLKEIDKPAKGDVGRAKKLGRMR